MITAAVIIKESLVILTIYLLGESIVFLLDSKFPGSVVGMLLLLSALHLKLIKVDDIRLVASTLLAYMPLFFIPAGVSVMTTYTLMDGFYWQIVLITMLSTLLVLIVTGKSVEYFIKKKEQ
jgi:holin-like protein